MTELTAETSAEQPAETPTNEPQPKDDAAKESEGEHITPEDTQEDPDDIEKEEDVDEQGREKQVSIKRVKAMAKQVKDLRNEIKELNQKIESDYVVKMDRNVLADALGDYSNYSSKADLDSAIDAYASNYVNDMMQMANFNMAANAKLTNSLYQYNPALVNHMHELADLPPDAAYAIAMSDHAGELVQQILTDPQLKNALATVPPYEAEKWIQRVGGEYKAEKDADIERLNSESANLIQGFTDSISSLTGGRVSVDDLNDVITTPEVSTALFCTDHAPEIALYLKEHPRALERLNGIGKQYQTLVELGRLEARAKNYAKSEQFLKKYPQSKQYAGETELKGSAIAPKGLNVKDDEEFNRRYNKRKGK